MVTAFVLSRLGGRAAARADRVWSVCLRDLRAAHSAAYALMLLAGFLEPVLYLLSMGFGVGGLVGEISLANGERIGYATFLAPAMLASSAMSGPLFESSIGFFSKMRFRKLFHATLSTPVSPFEIAAGELLWAMAQGAIYSVGFLVVMVAMGLAAPVNALAAFPATFLIGFACGAFGLVMATLMNSWQDFDYIGLVFFAMFMFSGTFSPVEEYPPAARAVVVLTPLYHGIELLRGLVMGTPDRGNLVDVGYLILMGCLGLWIASRRISGKLCR